MKALAEMDVRMRYALCAALVALSLLLLGAGRVNGEIKSRNEELRNSKMACKDAVMSLNAAVPSESRAKWESKASVQPEILLRACYADMRLKTR